MRAKVKVALTIVTALIILVGIVCIWSIVHGIPAPSGSYMVDGSEFLPIVWFIYLVALVGIIFLFGCICGTSCCVLWGIYWFVCFMLDRRKAKAKEDDLSEGYREGET